MIKEQLLNWFLLDAFSRACFRSSTTYKIGFAFDIIKLKLSGRSHPIKFPNLNLNDLDAYAMKIHEDTGYFAKYFFTNTRF